MAKNESIPPEDMELLFVTISVEEIADHIKTQAIKKFKLVRKPKGLNGRWEKAG